MSFILDALKKSETDRQRQSAPALFEVKVAAPRRRFPLWALGLGVLLGINMLVLMWVLLRSPSAEAPRVASGSTGGASGPAIAPPGTGTVPSTVTIPTTATYIPSNSAAQATIGSNNPDAGVVGPSHAPPLAEEPLLSGSEPSVPPDYDANDYAPAVTVAQANAAAEQRAGQVPSKDEVLARGTQLPDLRLDLHSYGIDPAERFVFINMRKLREGESLPDGVRVEKITQRGVELSYRGTRFSLDGD
jgi:general secretion pathway protein B